MERKYFDSNNTVMVHIRRIREKLGEDTKRPKFIKTIWGVDIKLKIKSITKLKIKLCLELLGNILLFLFIFFVVYFLITLLFENSLSVAVSNFNYDLYAFIVNNRDNILYVYLGIVLIISIYRFISKYVNSINEVYESLDLILKEDDEAIKLPSEVNDFSKKLNDIKYNYILSKKKEEDAIIKKNDLIMYMAHDLKTPLTSVIGYLTLLLDEKNISNKTEEKYLKIALDKALRVESLTNEFFDILDIIYKRFLLIRKR